MADTGGIDSSIPLGFQGGGAPAGGPNQLLGTMKTYADTQAQLNQNRLFQQTFAARQKAGQILATSPSLDEGLNGILKDPLTAPFAGEIVNQVRQSMLAQLQFQGEAQKQSTDAFTGVMKALSGGITDPKMVPSIIDSQLALLSPTARERVGPAMDSIKASLIDGLPSDPAQARQVFNQRMAGLSLAAGITPDTIRGITGALPPGTVQVTGPGGEAQTKVIGGPAAGGPPMSNALGGGGGPAGTGPADAAGTATGGANALGGGGPTAAGGVSPGNGIIASGPSTSRQEELKAAGSASGEIISDMQANSKNLPLQLSRMDTIVNTLKDFQAGGLADLRSDGAKILQGLKNAGVGGIDDSMINKVANGSLANTQEFSALIKRLATQQLTLDAKGQGRVLLPEVNAALDALSSTQDPKAIVGILDWVRRQYQISYDQSTKFLDFKKAIAKGDPEVKGLDLSDFYTWYNTKYKPEQLPLETGGGLSLGPIDATDIKGAGGPPAAAAGPKAPEKAPLSSFFK